MCFQRQPVTPTQIRISGINPIGFGSIFAHAKTRQKIVKPKIPPKKERLASVSFSLTVSDKNHAVNMPKVNCPISNDENNGQFFNRVEKLAGSNSKE